MAVRACEWWERVLVSVRASGKSVCLCLCDRVRARVPAHIYICSITRDLIKLLMPAYRPPVTSCSERQALNRIVQTAQVPLAVRFRFCALRATS